MSGEALRVMAAELSSKSPEEVAALADQAAAAQGMAAAPAFVPAKCGFVRVSHVMDGFWKYRLAWARTPACGCAARCFLTSLSQGWSMVPEIPLSDVAVPGQTAWLK